MTETTYYTEDNQNLAMSQTESIKRHIINAPLDALLMGGLSILFFFIAIIFFQQHSVNPYCITILFFLSFLVNFPHFLLSYQLLYIDFRHFIFKKFRFFWAAIIVPIVIIVSMILIAYFNPDSLGYFVNALYFFVGWHYIKQVFGVIIVTNALQKIFYTSFERWCLQVNLYSLWGIYWIWSNANGAWHIYEGIIYNGLNFPIQWVIYCYIAVIITFITVFVIHIKKYINEKSKPSLAASISFFSLYLWTVPLFYHPTFFYCLSFFHSLQYLPFVYAFRRNKIKTRLNYQINKSYFIQHYGYLLLSVLLGASLFYFLPRYLDQCKLVNYDFYGPTVMMFCFTIFLNIHHYFIDNVIWKKNNDEIKKYIFERQ